jgi:hypothetical protein
MRRLTRKHNTSSTREKHFNDLAHLRSQASPQLTHINNKLIQIYNKNTEITESTKHAQIEAMLKSLHDNPDHGPTYNTNIVLASTTQVHGKKSKMPTALLRPYQDFLNVSIQTEVREETRHGHKAPLASSPTEAGKPGMNSGEF